MSSMAFQSLALIASAVMSLLPMPIAATPAFTHLPIDSGVGSTPPVGMRLDQGMGPSTDATNFGPPTSSPGKTLHISQPSSSACEISETLPQPGE